MHRIDPRLARKLACAAVAVPVLVLAGCTSDDSGDGGGESESSSGPSESPSAAPAKFKQLPDPCKTMSKGTVKDVVPNAQSEKGKNLASTDTESYGSCLWSGGSGKNDSEYRALTISLKRYDSGPSLGSGDTQAQRFLKQESESVTGNKENEKVQEVKVSGFGQESVSIGYETKKKDQDYRANRTIVRTYNVVVTVDYEGTGFEDAKLPSVDELKKNSERVARETVAAVK